jgi:hypothetical protein
MPRKPPKKESGTYAERPIAKLYRDMLEHIKTCNGSECGIARGILETICDLSDQPNAYEEYIRFLDAAAHEFLNYRSIRHPVVWKRAVEAGDINLPVSVVIAMHWTFIEPVEITAKSEGLRLLNEIIERSAIDRLI